MRLAHISDLHFSHLSFHPRHFFSKRWVGTLNLFLNRKKAFAHEPLYALIPFLQELKVEGVLITGDLTTTSHPKEFTQARAFVDALEQAGLIVYLIPGNHDNYTRSAYKRLDFYRYFSLPSFDLKRKKVAAAPLTDGWWLIALDCSCVTSLFSSHGVFSEEIQKNLEELLAQLPPEQNVLLLNHFPLFETEKKKSLIRCQELQAFLRRSVQVKLYLHGHTHRQILADLRPSQLPIVVDAGSAAKKNQATFHLLDLEQTACTIVSYQRPSVEERWQQKSKKNFIWRSHDTALV